jgi:hypothetical protein
MTPRTDPDAPDSARPASLIFQQTGCRDVSVSYFRLRRQAGLDHNEVSLLNAFGAGRLRFYGQAA